MEADDPMVARRRSLARAALIVGIVLVLTNFFFELLPMYDSDVVTTRDTVLMICWGIGIILVTAGAANIAHVNNDLNRVGGGCVGCLGSAVLPMVAVLLLPHRDFRAETMGTACQSTMKQASEALLLYGEDDNGVLVGGKWADLAAPHMYYWASPHVRDLAAPQTKEPIRCPAVKGGPGIAENMKLVGKKISLIAHPESTPLLFDSTDLRPNAIAGLGTFAPRHEGKGNVACLDGSTKRVVRP